MLGSFERLRVGDALTLTEETLGSGYRFELKYILGTFCERISKKRGHARLSAKILHNLLSFRPSDRAASPAFCPAHVHRRHGQERSIGLGLIASAAISITLSSVLISPTSNAAFH
jgi:hypothetical protein